MENQLELETYKGIKINYRPGSEDKKVLDHSFEHDIFFKEIPSFRPSARPVIIDIGSHIGTFAMLCSIKYPQSTIYAYEASAGTFKILDLNKRLNKLEGLNVYHEAVAAVNGRTKLYHSVKTGNWGHSITKQHSPSFEEVNTTTLESIVSKNAIDFIDLIKLNCEGAEFGILSNAPCEILEKIGVGIILYHEDLDTENGDINSLASRFKRLNFRVVMMRMSPTRGWLIVWNRKYYSWTYFFIKALQRRLRILL